MPMDSQKRCKGNVKKLLLGSFSCVSTRFLYSVIEMCISLFLHLMEH